MSGSQCERTENSKRGWENNWVTRSGKSGNGFSGFPNLCPSSWFASDRWPFFPVLSPARESWENFSGDDSDAFRREFGPSSSLSDRQFRCRFRVPFSCAEADCDTLSNSHRLTTRRLAHGECCHSILCSITTRAAARTPSGSGSAKYEPSSQWPRTSRTHVARASSSLISGGIGNACASRCAQIRWR